MNAQHRAAVVRIAALSALPMAGAVIGGWFDEQVSLGFTTWRSACRAAGPRLATLADFTWQLLPLALTGMLLGGVAIVMSGALLRRRAQAVDCAAAHAGCALSLPAGLWLCASPMPTPLMLAADTAIAAGAALLIGAALRSRSPSVPAHP